MLSICAVCISTLIHPCFSVWLHVILLVMTYISLLNLHTHSHLSFVVIISCSPSSIISSERRPLYSFCIYFTCKWNPIKAVSVLTAEVCHPSRQKTWKTCVLSLFGFQRYSGMDAKAGVMFYSYMRLSGPVWLASTVKRINFIISVLLRPSRFP